MGARTILFAGVFFARHGARRFHVVLVEGDGFRCVVDGVEERSGAFGADPVEARIQEQSAEGFIGRMPRIAVVAQGAVGLAASELRERGPVAYRGTGRVGTVGFGSRLNVPTSCGQPRPRVILKQRFRKSATSK